MSASKLLKPEAKAERDVPTSHAGSLPRVARSFSFALLFLVLPPALLAAILTALVLHFLGVLSFHHWCLAEWLLAPARFVFFCYPLLILGAGMLAAAISSDQASLPASGLVALVWGLFSGIVVAWFPDPAIASFSKASRAAYAGALGAFFGIWCYAVIRRHSLTSG